MKTINRKMLFAGAILGSFLLGAAFLFLLFRAKPELATSALGLERNYARKIENQDPFAAARQQLFGGEDPFEEMEKMRKSLGDQGGLAGLMQLQGGDDQNVVEREDDQSVYYEISGVDQSKLSTRVENGYLTIKGESKKQSGQDGFSATMQSSFQRSFPLPAGVDEKKMEMSSEKDKVILRFPKRG